MNFPIAHLSGSLHRMCVSSPTPSPGAISSCPPASGRAGGGGLQKCLALQRHEGLLSDSET